MPRVFVIVSFIIVLFPLSATEGNAQNVEQVTGTQGVQCSEHGVVSDVPGLTLSLDTTGNPVLLIYTVQFNASPTGQITLWPAIDGVTELSGQRDRAIGDFSGQVADVTFARVFALASGAHTFGLRATCQSTVVFSTSWLTVYELPNSKHGKDQQ